MTPTRIYIQLFGCLRVVPNEGEPTVFAPQKTGSLLAYLALGHQKSHVREELITLLWPDDDVEEGRRKLRQRLFTLRQQLEDAPGDAGQIMLTNRSFVQLNVERVYTDVSEFEAALRDAASTSTPPTERLGALRRALDLYAGDLLPGFYLDEFVSERRRLADAYRGALHQMALLYEQLGSIDRAIEVARKVVSLDPLMEEAHRTLIRLFAAAGQPASARRQFQELERVLEDELGEQPSDETRRLLDSLRQHSKAKVEGPGPVSANVSLASNRAAIEDTDTTAPVDQPKRIERAGEHAGLRARPRSFGFVTAVLVGIAVCFVGFFRWRTPNHSPAHGATLAAPAGPQFGCEQWVARYKLGPGDTTAEPTAVAVDDQGNSYITGFVKSTKPKHDVDFLTLKYDPNGVLGWEAPRYNGPSGDVDRARCIALDLAGNVYVTGESDNGTTDSSKTRLDGTDFATIKYGPDGKPSPTWPDVGYGVGVRRYNGPDNGEDRPVQMKIDAAGNVYVLGYSWGKGKTGKAGYNYALVKYDAAGKEQWTARYDGDYGSDIPVGMVVDEVGNVYVTGTSRNEPSSGPETNFLTIKYDRNGRQTWEAPYGENNLTDDAAKSIGGNGFGINVVGEARGAPGTPDADRKSVVVATYDLNGKLLHVRGAFREQDRLTAVHAAEPAGGLFAAGDGIRPVRGGGEPVLRIVARTAEGLPLWTQDYAPHTKAVVVAVTGEVLRIYGVFPRSTGQNQLVTLRFDGATGEVIREWAYRDPYNLLPPVAVAMDGFGRSTVACQTGQPTIVLLRYSP